MVAEYEPTGLEPSFYDDRLLAEYWTGIQSERWAKAVSMEPENPVVLCDGDPVKLHYSWSLAWVGAGSATRFEQELSCVRAAVETGRLGFADLVIVSIPPYEVLLRQKLADHTRTRRSFDLHATLAAPLREWYQAVERADPTRVRWSLPDEDVQLPETGRVERSSPALLERVLEHLPPLARR